VAKAIQGEGALVNFQTLAMAEMGKTAAGTLVIGQQFLNLCTQKMIELLAGQICRKLLYGF
jgi:hypothetical protein